MRNLIVPIALASLLMSPIAAQQQPENEVVALVELTECGAPVAIEVIGTTGIRVFVRADLTFEKAVAAFKVHQEVLKDAPTLVVEINSVGCKTA